MRAISQLRRPLKMKRTTSIAFSPNGKVLASGDSCGGAIKLWDVRSGKELKQLAGNFFEVVTSVAFSPDGKTLASGTDNGAIRLWDIDSGKELSTCFDRFN
jgi:WD40 repeat protein